MRVQIRLPARIARVGNLRPFGMTDTGVDGVGVPGRALHAFRLIGEQRFMHAAPVRKIGNQLELRPRGEKLHRRRRAEQRAAAMRLVIHFHPVLVGQRGGVVEEGKIFFQREMIAAGVRIEIQRFQNQGPFVLLLETGGVFGNGAPARPPLLRDDGQAQFIKRLPRALAGFHVERNVQLNAVETAGLDFLKRSSSVGKSSRPQTERKYKIFIGAIF